MTSADEYDPFAEEEQDSDLVKLERVILGRPLSEAVKVVVSKAKVSTENQSQDCFYIPLPGRLKFYCPDDDCGRQQYHDWLRPPLHRQLGLRTGAKIVEFARVSGIQVAEYRCGNCTKSEKAVLLSINFASGEVSKAGEFPPEGDPIPRRLLDLVDPYGSLLIKGYQIEQRGFGIGAYAYYRRVVEQEKIAFLNEVKKVAVLKHAPQSAITQIDKAITNRSFEKAMEQVKGAVPKELYIGTENPFTLLHETLSKGIHSMKDEECLAIAEVVREILTEFAERSQTLLREPKKLQAAVTALRKATTSKRRDGTES